MVGMRFFKGWLGPFKLLKRYTSQPPGPGRDDPGRLYQASHLLTRSPALVLIPSEHSPLEPLEEWRVRLRSQSTPPFLSLEVELAPSSGRLSHLRGMLSLLATCVERVDHSEEALAHLTHRPSRLAHAVRAFWYAHQMLYRWVRASPWRTLAACICAFLSISLGALTGQVQLHLEREARLRAAPQEAMLSAAQRRAPTLVDIADEPPAPLAYPLPATPFSDQAKAPCNPKKGQVEINGGCWVALEKQPPCYEDQAEYQGKCYLPVSARSQKPREPRAVQP